MEDRHNPRGRSGGRAGGAGYDLQDLYVALQLAHLLIDGDGPRGTSEVIWEKKAIDAGPDGLQSLAVDDVVIVRSTGRRVHVEVKATGPGARWSIESLIRAEVIQRFWQQWQAGPLDSAPDIGLRLATGAPAPELALVADAARRARTVAELTGPDASKATAEAVERIARALEAPVDDALLAFLRGVEVEALPPPRELELWISRALSAAEPAATELAALLVAIVHRSKEAGADGRAWHDRASLVSQLAAEGAPEELLRLVGVSAKPLASRLLEQFRAIEFTGCASVIEALDGELRTSPGGYVELRGGSATGKTALLAELAAKRSWPIHFCHVAPAAADFRSFLIAVLEEKGGAAAVPPGIAATPTGISVPALLEALSGLGGEEGPTVVLVDDVDAALSDGAETALFLPPRVPDGLFLVVSTAGKEPLAGLDPHGVATIQMDSRSDSLDDLATYLRARFAADPRLVPIAAGWEGDLPQAVFEAVDGNWLHAVLVLDDLASGRTSPEEVARIPRGLDAYYSAWWGRWRAKVGGQAWASAALPALAVLVCMGDPPTVAQVGEAAGVSSSVVYDLIGNEWERFFLLVDDRVVWRSSSHRDVLEASREPPFAVGFAEILRKTHLRLGGIGVERALASTEDADVDVVAYGLRYAVTHLLRAGARERAADLVLGQSDAWASAHSRVESGNDFRSDIVRVWEAYAANPEPGSECVVARLLRTHAAIYDAAEGASVYLIGAALKAGLIQRHHLRILAGATTEELHALALLTFAQPDTEEGRSTALALLDQQVAAKSPFLGGIFVHSSRERQRRLLTQAASLAPKERGRVIEDVVEIWVQAHVLYTWDWGELLSPVAAVDDEMAREAAAKLVSLLPLHQLAIEQCRTALEPWLEPDVYDRRMALLYLQSKELERDLAAKDGLIEAINRARLLARGEVDPEGLRQLVDLVKDVKEKESEMVPLYFVTQTLDGLASVADSDPGEIDEQGWSAICKDLRDLARRLAEGAGECSVFDPDSGRWLFGGHDSTEPGDYLAAFEGDQVAFAEEFVEARMRTDSRGSLIVGDHFIHRARALRGILPWLPNPDSLIERMLEDAGEEASPLLRRSIVTPLFPVLRGESLRRAVQVTTAGFAGHEANVLGFNLATSGEGEGDLPLGGALAPLLRFRWLAARDDLGEDEIVEALKLMPDDFGMAEIAKIGRSTASFIDGGGHHQDITSALVAPLQFSPMRHLGQVERLAAQLGWSRREEVARELLEQGRHALAANVLEKATGAGVEGDVTEALLDFVRRCLADGAAEAALSLFEMATIHGDVKDSEVEAVADALFEAFARACDYEGMVQVAALAWEVTGTPSWRSLMDEAVDLVRRTPLPNDHVTCVQILLAICRAGVESIPRWLLDEVTESEWLMLLSGAGKAFAKQREGPQRDLIVSLLGLSAWQMAGFMMMAWSPRVQELLEGKEPSGWVEFEELAKIELREEPRKAGGGGIDDLELLLAAFEANPGSSDLRSVLEELGGLEALNAVGWLAALGLVFAEDTLIEGLRGAGYEEEAIDLALRRARSFDEISNSTPEEEDGEGRLQWSSVTSETLDEAWKNTHDGFAAVVWRSELARLLGRDCPDEFYGPPTFALIG